MTNTDALTGKLLEIINQVQDTVSSHSDQAINLVLTSTQIDGICWLLCCFFVTIIGILLVYLDIKYFSEHDHTDFTLLLLLIPFVAFLLFIYPWNWIQVFNPKLYLAHEIIGKVLD